MDVASAVAVKALDIQPLDHVLDLCCAPGTKLCYISFIQSHSSARSSVLKRHGKEKTEEKEKVEKEKVEDEKVDEKVEDGVDEIVDEVEDGVDGKTEKELKPLLGSITGNDVSKARLFTCRALIKKHAHQNTRLFLGDGTRFGVHAPTRIGQHLTTTLNTHKPLYQEKPFYAKSFVRFDEQLIGDEVLYDKVIVDAECTHDGSIAHVLKYTSSNDFDRLVLCKERLDALSGLQVN